MGWRQDILRQSADLQARKQRKRQRKARWYERIAKRMLGQGKSKKETQDFIAGTGKHRRQRTRPPGYWARKRTLQKERMVSKRAILMRERDKQKKVRNRKRKKAERR